MLLLVAGIIWYFSVFRSFKILKEDIERFDSLKCFEGSQGSLVRSNYLESVRKAEIGPQILLEFVFSGILYLLMMIWDVEQWKRIKRI